MKPIEHALTLIARINSGDAVRATAAQCALEAWRKAAPEHEAVYREAEARWRVVGEAIPGVRGDLPDPRLPASRRRGGRVARAASALGLMLLCAYALRWYLAQPLFEQEYRTATAQLARAELPDGSRLDLGPRTDLRVRYYRDRRSLELEGGEVRFDVAADAARPFSVATPRATVSVLGTVFSVTQRDGPLTVAVERGRVSVRPLQPELPVRVLEPGLKLVLGPTGEGALLPIGAEQQAAWRAGWLVFDDTPLAEAASAINAYLAQPIRLSDGSVGRLRLTGSFRADDIAAILRALPRVLPVVVRNTPSGPVIAARR